MSSYINDPRGRRVTKKTNGTITEKYLWSGLTTLLAVYASSNNLMQRFEYADGRMPYAMTASGSTYYLSYDQVGSLRLVVDSTGTIVKRIDYDSFGNIINDSNSSFAIPFGFAGGLSDSDTGLIRFGFRDYLPEIGKWTAKDPILFAGGDSNLYGYVANNPVNWVDPIGLNPALLIQAENFVLIHGPEIIEAAGSLMPHTPANHYVGQIYSVAPEITNGLIQANQTLGQCVLDSAEYLAMDAAHDIMNKAIPAVLDGIANEWNRATTPKPPSPKPVPSFTQGPLK